MKKFCFVLLAIAILTPLTFAQEYQQVNPALILQECTNSRTTCEKTEQTCAEYNNNVSTQFHWTSLTMLLGMALINLAIWFTVFSLAAIYRYIRDLMRKNDVVKYVQQLENANKIILEQNKIMVEQKKLTQELITELERGSISLQKTNVELVEALKKKLGEEIKAVEKIEQSTESLVVPPVPEEIIGEKVEVKKPSFVFDYKKMMKGMTLSLFLLVLLYAITKIMGLI